MADDTEPTTSFTMRLPQSLKKAVDDLAYSRRTTVSALVRELIERELTAATVDLAGSGAKAYAPPMDGMALLNEAARLIKRAQKQLAAERH